MQISKCELFRLSPALPRQPLSSPKHLSQPSSACNLSPGVASWHRHLLDPFSRRISFCYVGPHPHQGSILTAKPSLPSSQTSLKQPKSSKPLHFFCMKQISQASGEFLYDIGKHYSFASVRNPKAKSWHVLHLVIMFPNGGLWLRQVSLAFITLATPRRRWMSAVLMSQRLSVPEESGSAPQTCAILPSYTVASGTSGRKASIRCTGPFRGFGRSVVLPHLTRHCSDFIPRLFLFFFPEEN